MSTFALPPGICQMRSSGPAKTASDSTPTNVGTRSVNIMRRVCRTANLILRQDDEAAGHRAITQPPQPLGERAAVTHLTLADDADRPPVAERDRCV